jgi:hypothetical protein
MTCEVPRTYIPVPQLLNTGDSLPTVPTSLNDWDGMRRLLEAIRQSLGGTSQSTNTTVPAQVKNFTATAKAGGTLLTWDFLLNGGYYLLYRNTSNDLSSAYTMGIITEGNTRRGQFLDPCGQDAAGVLIYYWIQPYSLGGIPGAFSLATKASVGCQGVTSFSDTFIRGDQPFLAGDQWLLCLCPGGAGQGNALSFATAYNVGGTGLTMGTTGSNGNSSAMSIPNVLDLATIQSLGQFSQYTVVADNSTSVGPLITRRGPMVLANQNRQACYVLYCVFEVGPTATLTKINPIGGTEPALGVAFTIAVGDVLRIEADPTTSSSTTTTIRSYRNGVLKDTIIDTNAGLGGTPRITNGVPGFLDRFCSSGVTTTISNFSCGLI